MDKQVINATSRKELGKSAAKKLRKEGSIPAVVYDDKGKSVSITLNTKEFNKVWRSITKTTPITLKLDGAEHLALIKEVEYNILKDEVLHADLFIPNKTQLLKYKMKVLITGNAQGVLKGGFLLKHSPEITIKASIDNLPERVSVDVSKLNIGDSIKVKDLQLGSAVTILTPKEEELVSISPAR